MDGSHDRDEGQAPWLRLHPLRTHRLPVCKEYNILQLVTALPPSPQLLTAILHQKWHASPHNLQENAGNTLHAVTRMFADTSLVPYRLQDLVSRTSDEEGYICPLLQEVLLKAFGGDTFLETLLTHAAATRAELTRITFPGETRNYQQ
eukprot:11332797-Karenia_brevis.AAC.1